MEPSVAPVLESFTSSADTARRAAVVSQPVVAVAPDWRPVTCAKRVRRVQLNVRAVTQADALASAAVRGRPAASAVGASVEDLELGEARRADLLACGRQRAFEGRHNHDSWATALGWLLQYKEFIKCPEALFYELQGPDDAEASAHNERQLVAFGEWLMRVVSQKSHRPLKPETVKDYMSAARAAVEFQMEQKLVLPNWGTLLPAFRKSCGLYVSQAPAKHKRGPVRAALFAAAAARGYTVCSAMTANHWAMLLTGWVGMLRGGELGATGNSPWTAGADLSRADLTFFPHGGPISSMPYATVEVIPLKKTGVKLTSRQRALVFIPKADGGPNDAYQALWDMVHVWDPVPAEMQADTPLFRNLAKGEKAWFTTDDISVLVQSLARHAGVETVGLSSHSLRIGGVTDAKAAGVTADEVKRMGRWDSDAHAIYDRGDLGLSMSKMLMAIQKRP